MCSTLIDHKYNVFEFCEENIVICILKDIIRTNYLL